MTATERPTRWLSCHVGYACRHSGACCRSGWPLPVEVVVVAAIDEAVAGGRLRTVDDEARWLDQSPHAPEGDAGILRQAGGGCVFHLPVATTHDAAPSGRCTCTVHTALGHAALPASCQHFPRLCLIDDRGVRVTLSHYCPTAAALLVDDNRPVTVVDGPSAVPGRPVPEGLDVRGDLPPRLSERVLADLDGMTAWERHVVETLAGPLSAGTAEQAVAQVHAQARLLVTWKPSSGVSLAAAVSELAPTEAPDVVAAARELASPATWPAWFEVAASTCRAPWLIDDPPAGLADLDARFVAPVWDRQAPAVRRYLAAKAFAAWITYQADAAVSLAAWLTLCHAVLRIETARACGAASRPLDRDLLVQAIRQSDLLLCHYSDSLAIAGTLGDRAKRLGSSG